MNSYFSSQASLAVTLSKLKSFETQDIKQEQYPTPSALAAEILWIAHMQGDIQGTIADFGCGTGIFGLGALLLGASHVHFVESEAKALALCKENYARLREQYPDLGKVSFHHQNVSDFHEKVDTILQNPPFGTKEKHIDQVFLARALACARVVYTIHKASTKTFIDRFIDEKNATIADYFTYDFPIKAAHHFHKKPKKDILVGVWRIIRN